MCASIITPHIVYILPAHQMTSCATTGESAFSGWKYVMDAPTVPMAQMRSSVSQQILLLSVSSRKLQHNTDVMLKFFFPIFMFFLSFDNKKKSLS